MARDKVLLDQEWGWRETAGWIVSQAVLAGVAVAMSYKWMPGCEASSLEGSALTMATQLWWLVRSKHSHKAGELPAPGMLAVLYRAEFEKIFLSVGGLWLLFSLKKGKMAQAALIGFIVPQAGMWLFWIVVQLRCVFGKVR